MKKILPLILLVSLLLSIHVAVAEADFDFTSYSYEQLIGIKEQLDAEITTRPEAGERILQPGQYVVGKDIAQGVYDVGFVAAEEDDTYTNWYHRFVHRRACHHYIWQGHLIDIRHE